MTTAEPVVDPEGDTAPESTAQVSGTPTTRRTAVVRGLRGIRGRVVLGYVLLVAGALVLTMLVVRQVLIVRTDRQIEESLVQEVEELRILADGTDPSTGEPFGTDAAAIFDTFLSRNVTADGEVLLTIVDGEPYKETLGAPVDLAQDAELVRRWSTLEAPLRLDVGSGEDEARTLAVPLLDAGGTTAGVFIVIYFPAGSLAEVGQAVRVIGLVGLAVLIVAAIVALALARRVLQPVSDLTDTARRISDNDLTARFDGSGDDELAVLGVAFNDMLDRLQSGFSAQRDVLDDVAHELRTPITIVRGHLELLDDDPADRAATVELCLDELDRMGRYVDELLLVASARRPDFLSVGPVDVGELAEGLLARSSALADRDWQLVEAPRPGEVFVEGDTGRLTQAVLNLAANAAQHTEPGATIELSVQHRGPDVQFSVRDHGPGIAPDVREQMFSRFSRAAGSRSTRPEGTGLGLAIVAAIAEAHGGSVAADDPPGGGARVTVTVPAIDVGTDEEELS
jgi:signal transduction histidine kinase